MPIDSRDRVVSRVDPAPAGPCGPASSRGSGFEPRVLPRRPRRIGRLIAVIGLITIMLGVAAAFVVTRFGHLVPTCTATIGDETYHLDREQAANARTIAAVAKEQGMPNHAVTVAIAAALQESKMHNISHGDRDSVGLFQQRPSQGWGTPEQLTTPTYAAAAFYRELSDVEGWETMSVTDAAQQVQRSAAPDVYSQWEGEARVLARILTGEVPDRLVCH